MAFEGQCCLGCRLTYSVYVPENCLPYSPSGLQCSELAEFQEVGLPYLPAAQPASLSINDGVATDREASSQLHAVTT